MIRNTSPAIQLSKAVALSISLLFLAACDDWDTPISADPVEKVFHPIKVVLMQDQTISTTWTRTPQLAPGDLEPFRELFHRSGGEIAVGLVRERSNRSLVRKLFPPPVTRPQSPTEKGDIFEDAQSAEDYQNRLKLWREECRRRHERIDQMFDEFLEEIKPLLERKADAGRTDIWGAVIRGDLFLNESDAIWPLPTHRYFILASDGQDNLSKKPVVLKSGAQVLLANGSASVGPLGTLNPNPFESVQAAIQHVIASEGQQ
jgi:hypothetical protein